MSVRKAVFILGDNYSPTGEKFENHQQLFEFIHQNPSHYAGEEFHYTIDYRTTSGGLAGSGCRKPERFGMSGITEKESRNK